MKQNSESETKVVRAYKGFNKNLQCSGFQYEVGKEYKLPDGEKPKACERGFHACENPFDVLDYYGDILNNRYCEVEQSGDIVKSEDKTASSRIKVKAEIGFTGLFKAGIEWLKEITSPVKVIEDTKDADTLTNDNGGYYAQIGSSGDSAQIVSTGEDSVICCAGHDSAVKAKQGSWITLAEWEYSEVKNRFVPKYVKTEYVDGERIKADTWYKLVDGEFVEQK